MGKNYYPQVFLGECKYIVKEKEVTRHIIEDLEISPDVENSYEENSNKENFIELIKHHDNVFLERNFDSVFFEEGILKMFFFEGEFLRDQFWKCLFPGCNLEEVV